MYYRYCKSLIRALISVLALWLPPSVALTADPDITLLNYLKKFNTLEVDFEQISMDQQGAQIERAWGKMFLQRPNKFRWDYHEPYRQTIVANGKTLWIYDSDLEQVTIREDLLFAGDTPMAILISYENVKKHFVLSSLGVIEGYDWIQLTPKRDDSHYHSIRLAFERDRLGMLVMSDNLGQITRIDFSGEKNNPTLKGNIFTFNPPVGTDIIRQ